MSAVRLALLTGAATAVSFGLFYLWLRSPLALALLGAALFGTAFMTVGASLGDDPLAADEAWRLEAGDLATREPPHSIAAEPNAPALPGPVERDPERSETGAEPDPGHDAG
jgi:hypothetical protein